MKKFWLLPLLMTVPLLAATPAKETAVKESPVKDPPILENPKRDIELPPSIQVETTTQMRTEASVGPMSVTEKDPKDPSNWRLYDNRVVRVHLRVKASWTVMEFKESDTTGTVSFTLSRLPLITFSIVRSPMVESFETYLKDDTLASLYTKILKKRPGVIGGRKGMVVIGTIEGDRQDESHFSTDGKSFYRISFSAPAESWKDAEAYFEQIEKDFRWL